MPDLLKQQNTDQQQNTGQEQDKNGENQQVDINEYNELKKELEAKNGVIKKYRGYEDSYKEFTKMGVTPDQIKEMLESQQKSKEQEQLARGEFDAVKKQIIESAEQKYKSLEENYNSLYQQFSTATISDNLKSELSNAGATNTGVDILSRLLQGRAKLDNVDGKFVTRVYDDAGNPMANAKGDATLTDLVEDAKTKYSDLFQASVKSGSGMQPKSGEMPNNQSKQISSADYNQLTPHEKLAKQKSGYTVVD